ncbi:MAG: Fic family protein [Saprospiraceae bacterium]|nr:Fic family protein [Candidatus Vicinibacter affinis]
MINNRFSLKITVFHGRMSPEEGFLVGYGALLEAYKLEVPVPDVLALISTKKREYKTDEWQVFTSRYLPEDSLYKHLIFALKYEGINLLLLKKLFEKLSEEETLALIKQEPTGQYSRRLWFLYEWLLKKQLDTEDIQLGNYIPLVDMELQFAITKGEKSVRHRIINNLPGINGFCPLIRKTDKLNQYIEKNISTHTEKYIKDIHAEVLKRASAFLLLKDSKASFTIEGESPKSKRMARWGQAIGQAGRIELNKEELLRLQQIIIENPRFVDMGFRNKGGFIGEHDRITGEPLPDHISAKWQDLDHLMTSLIQTNQMLLKSDMDAVLSATIIAFGFVFIHPFEDGNGRLHRYLIHHILSKKQFSKQGMIFPVSASILDHIVDYRKVLEAYSLPLLDYIDWRETNDHNIEVLNDTMDYYAYFDATKQAEFMYDCVMDTIENIIPREVNYIIRYDQFKRYIEDEFEMPDKLVALLVRFLEQNGGSLSKRAKENEFDKLNEEEISKIETEYQKIFT